jgi:hypothetical protein
MWYLAVRRNVEPRSAWTVSLDDHLTWMRDMHEQGSILLSEPSAAERIASADPFTANGHCVFELIERDMHQVLGVGPFSSSAFRASPAEA